MGGKIIDACCALRDRGVERVAGAGEGENSEQLEEAEQPPQEGAPPPEWRRPRGVPIPAKDEFHERVSSNPHGENPVVVHVLPKQGQG